MAQNHQTSIDQYRKQKLIKIEPPDCVRHLEEPTDINVCIFCGDLSGIKHGKRFKRLQKLRKYDLEDKLIFCEGSDCSFKFHLSCITYETPMTRFNAVYLAQAYNTGKLQCPAHYCEACFTYGRQQTASRKRGEWIKVESQIRVFHPRCIPLHAQLSDKPNCIILPEQEVFHGERLQCCVECGRRAELKGREENSFAPDYNLVGCETCVQMFHPTCHQSVSQNIPNTRCGDCINNTPIRLLEYVLIHKEGTTMFCAAEVVDVQQVLTEKGKKSTKIGYRFLSDDPETLRWTSFNHLFRIYPSLAPYFYHTMMQIYSEHTCSVEERNTHRTELNFLAEHMQNQFFSNYCFRRPEPVFQAGYIIDDEFRAKFPGNYLPPVPYEEFPGLAVLWSRRFGYLVKTTCEIPAKTRIGEYIGRIITDETLKNMQALAKASSDQEAAFYNFESRVVSKNGNFTCAIDASVHGNKMSILNHSCKPNCVVKRELYSLEDGLVMERMVVWSTKSIKAGRQLMINYRWRGMKTYCHCPKCRKKPVIFEDRQLDCGLM
ncbi:unnamed protein product [Caenorhabditis brenneri]